MDEKIASERKRFGEIAVSLGLVSEASIREALAYQEKQKQNGCSMRLGESLIELGYIKPSDTFYIFQAQHIAQQHNPTARFLGQKIQKIKLTRFLGKGGMGEVYMGEHVELGRKVAVKFLSPALAADEQYVERFLWEAQASAKLSHPNIVQTYDVGTFEATFYILMEYIDGISLATLIREENLISVDRCILIISQAAQGLAAAHKSGIIHRDIKPENIMLTQEGLVKIMDFGLARSLDHYKGMTAAGQVMGTPEYISPEACKGDKIDARSDIYSLGITFYESLTGNPPFHSKSPMAIMLDHISTAPVSPDRINPIIPHDLARIVMASLSKNPAQRYPSMWAFLDDLEKFKKCGEQGLIPFPARKKNRVSSSFYFFAKLCGSKKNERFFKPKFFFCLCLVFLLIIVGAIWRYYESGQHFQTLVEKEQSLPLRERIQMWNEFIFEFPNSQYVKDAIRRTELAREDIFYEEIIRTSKDSKTLELAVHKLQLYLNAYPNGRYEKEVQLQIERYKEKIPVLIKINSNPSGASFLVNGKIEGNTPCIASFIRGKEYTLNFYLKGYQSVVMKFIVSSPPQQELVVKLDPLQTSQN